MTCSSCLTLHAHTLEVHCDGCAARACMACAVRADGVWLCIHCAGPDPKTKKRKKKAP